MTDSSQPDLKHSKTTKPQIAAPNIETSIIDEPSKLLWFANVAISPGLLLIANDLMNNPRRAGMTRLSDELQIIMSVAVSSTLVTRC